VNIYLCYYPDSQSNSPKLVETRYCTFIKSMPIVSIFARILFFIFSSHHLECYYLRVFFIYRCNLEFLILYDFSSYAEHIYVAGSDILYSIFLHCY